MYLFRRPPWSLRQIVKWILKREWNERTNEWHRNSFNRQWDRCNWKETHTRCLNLTKEFIGMECLLFNRVAEAAKDLKNEKKREKHLIQFKSVEFFSSLFWNCSLVFVRVWESIVYLVFFPFDWLVFVVMWWIYRFNTHIMWVVLYLYYIPDCNALQVFSKTKTC